jgi:TonB-dependent receptor
MPKTIFKKRALATCVAMAAASGVYAQDDAPEVEEVLVTGIRASQASAVSLKRDAKGVVDGIVAEDIGKLPDVTITDSLQRITGIQIQRSAGEGGILNIRGFGQVSTLLNGEQMLTPSNLGSAQPNLNDIPAALMKGVDVYKSQNLDNAVSGITGTIDLKTRRPMDFDEGLSSTVGLELGQGTENGETDPLFNGLVNWRNERFGVLLAGSMGEATLLNNESGWTAGGPNNINHGWGPGTNGWASVPGDIDPINPEAPDTFDGKRVISGHGFDLMQRDTERSRHALNFSLQTDLGDGFTLTAEAFYAKKEETNRTTGLNLSNRWGATDNMWPVQGGWNDTGVVTDGGEYVNTTTYGMNALWVNTFGRGESYDARTRNYNFQLDYDNGGPFTMQARLVRSSADFLKNGGQTQTDLSNWAGSQRTKHATFYPADVAADIASQWADEWNAQHGNVAPDGSSRAAAADDFYRDDLGFGEDGGRFIQHSPLGYGEDPVLYVDTSGGEFVWSGLDQELTGGLGDGEFARKATLAEYLANPNSYYVTNTTSESNQYHESTLDTASIKGEYTFDEPLGGFITSVEAGVRNSARSVEISNFHIFASVWNESDAHSSNVSEGGCAVQWRATDVQLDNTDNCTAGELLFKDEAGDVSFEVTENPYNGQVYVDNYITTPEDVEVQVPVEGGEEGETETVIKTKYTYTSVYPDNVGATGNVVGNSGFEWQFHNEFQEPQFLTNDDGAYVDADGELLEEGADPVPDMRNTGAVGVGKQYGGMRGDVTLVEGEVFAAYRAAPALHVGGHGEADTATMVWTDGFGGLPGFYSADPRSFDDALGYHERTFGADNVGIVKIPGDTYDVDLEEFSYDVTFNYEFGDVVTGDFGVRVIDTELVVKQNETGQALPYTNTAVDVGDIVTRVEYSDVLPVLNLAYTPTEELVFRLSYSETMMPLDLGRYGGGFTVSTGDCEGLAVRCATGATRGGNPNLKPWRASNIDLSAEYYLGEASMVALGLYQIDIETFVGTETTFGPAPDEDGVVRREVSISGPLEGEGGSVDGIELAAKFAFSDIVDDGILSYFGVDANYTYSPSESEELDPFGKKFPFVNNSENIINIAGWFENDYLQARLAVNNRDDRFTGTTLGVAGSSLGRYQAATTYVDMNITYHVTEDVDVYLNGSNITNESEEFYIDFTNGSDEQLRLVRENEARWTLGVRASF